MRLIGYFKINQPTYKQCDFCESLFLHPYPTYEELSSYYAEMGKYGSYSMENSHFRNHSILSFLKNCKIIASKEFKNWLDYGCFDGFIFDEIQNRGFVGFGVEIQSQARESAQSKAKGRVSHSIETINLNDQIHVISMKDSIEHLLDPNVVFKGFSRIASHNAQLFIQTPNATSLSALIFKKKWACLNSPEHTIIFSKKGLEVFLIRHGWKVQKTRIVFKVLTIGYVLSQLENFGSFQQEARKITRLMPVWVKDIKMPFIGGEIFIHAVRGA
jgi:hypothetical protein